MTPDLIKLRNEVAKSNNIDAVFLRGCIADLIKDKVDRNLLNICLNAGVLQDFFNETTHDSFFIRRCIIRLIEEFYISESGAEKAIEYCKFLLVEEPEMELIPFRKGNKWGFCDKKKNILIDCVFDDVKRFQRGLASVLIGSPFSGKWLFIDITGKIINSRNYGYPYRSNDVLLKVPIANLNRPHFALCEGFLNNQGKEITGGKYGGVENFHEGIALVWDYVINKGHSDFLCGFIDTNGEEIIPLKYLYYPTASFSNGLALVCLNDKAGFIDRFDKEIIPFKYDRSSKSFSEGLALVCINRKFGFIDRIGQEIIPFKYDEPSYSFNDGLASVRLKDKSGFIDKDGMEIIPFKYEQTMPFSEGISRVKLKGKNGYINSKGEQIIDFKYELARDFSEGFATVYFNGNWILIDRFGHEIPSIKKSYEIMKFKNGLSHVVFKNENYYSTDGTMRSRRIDGYIDLDGTEYWEY